MDLMGLFGLRKITDYFFPVLIHDHGDGLRIEDRRPDFDLVTTWAGFIAVIVLLIAVGVPMIVADIYIPVVIMAVGLLYLGYRSATRYFRVIYGFDKTRNKYTFVRQSLLNKDLIEGDIREFTAVQVEHAVVSGEYGSYDIYRVGLVLEGGLNLGRHPTQYLRSTPPFLSDYEPEARIADAVADFLNIRFDGQVDVSSFQGPVIGF